MRPAATHRRSHPRREGTPAHAGIPLLCALSPIPQDPAPPIRPLSRPSRNRSVCVLSRATSYRQFGDLGCGIPIAGRDGWEQAAQRTAYRRTGCQWRYLPFDQARSSTALRVGSTRPAQQSIASRLTTVLLARNRRDASRPAGDRIVAMARQLVCDEREQRAIVAVREDVPRGEERDPTALIHFVAGPGRRRPVGSSANTPRPSGGRGGPHT